MSCPSSLSLKTLCYRLLKLIPRGVICSVYLLLISTFAHAIEHSVSQNKIQSQDIQLRPPIQREIGGTELHSYRVVLPAAHLAHFTIDQLPIDVSISLFGPDNVLVTKHDLRTSGESESISILSDIAATYRLEVQARDESGSKGSYRITMDELRPAKDQDKARIAAERMFSTAMQLLVAENEETRRKALEKFEQGRSLAQSGGDQASEAWALYWIAYLHLQVGEIPKAIEIGQRAIPLAQAAGDRKTHAYLLDTIGSAHDRLGDKKKSLEFFNQALTFRDDTDRLGKAHTLNNIGIAYGWMGDSQKSIDSFLQVLAVLRELGNRRREATLLNNLCTMHTNISEYKKAIEFCNQSLRIKRELKDESGVGTAVNTLGNVYSNLGEYQKALDSYLQSLAIHKKLGERDGEGAALNNIGWVYATLGDYDKANDYYNQSINVIRASGDKYALSTAIANLGVNYLQQKDFRKALEFNLQALQLARETNNAEQEAISLSNIGSSHSNLGDKQKGLEFYTKSLELHRKVGNQRQLAGILRNIGNEETQLGENQKGLDHLNEALSVSRSIADRNGEGAALNWLARFERKRGNLKEALKFIEQALTTVESLRINIRAAHLRASYFATVRRYYELNIGILMDLHKQEPSGGFDAAALQVSEKSRARSLLELLKEARAEIHRGVDPLLMEREGKLRFMIADKAARQTRLLMGKHTDEQRLAGEKELEQLTNEYEQLQAQIRTTSPRYAALTLPIPLDLKQIQKQVLDDDTLLLEYSLGEERSFVWAVTNSSLKTVELPKRAEIEPIAQRLYDALVARNQIVADESAIQRTRRLEKADADYLDAAAQLSRLILAPIGGELKNKRLLVVSEGALQYVPFAVLPSPSDTPENSATARNVATAPLILNHEIVNLPSASVLDLIRREAMDRKPPDKTLVVFADPVFSENDERIASRQRNAPPVTAETSQFDEVKRSATESGLNDLVRLRFSRLEADEITKLTVDKMKLKAVDFEANRTLATGDSLGQYQIVHFATHGLINNRYPELSGVILSLVDAQGRAQNGFLRLYDIYNLKLNADLVVLSACQTALGREIRGEGIVGLTRGFMYAGSPRVVASLWQTDDRATAQLMQRFYNLMLGEKLRPAAALRAAQISMLREKRWQSPRYWAAFTLQGEWK